MASLKEMIGCVGILGDEVSVLSDWFGFNRGRLPIDPRDRTIEISILDHIILLQNDHIIHLNCFLVGAEDFTYNFDIGRFEDEWEIIPIDYAYYQ